MNKDSESYNNLNFNNKLEITSSEELNNTMDYNKKLYEKNFKKLGLDMNIFVSAASAILVLFFISYVLLFPELSATVFGNIQGFITEKFNWLFVLTVFVTFVGITILALSKYGTIRLGGPTARPEYSNFAWYSMLFSAGIGIGIFFYGIAEPITHMQNIPARLQSGNNVLDAFKTMYLHWGFNAWAIYAIVGIGLGYFAFNRGLPLSLRSLFYPLIKDKIYGICGDIIDTLAVLSVLFGLATSLGLGSTQINAGLNYVFGISINSTVQVILIACITFIATLSVVSGISKGIKFLSEANFYISGLLLGFILLLGPTSYILSTYLTSLGGYLQDFFNIVLYSGVAEANISWQSGWTVFYWAWWISWSPFVGIFIARISKGRTVREIVIGTVYFSSLIIFFVMTILGATGIYLDQTNNGVITTAVNSDISTAMFEMIRQLISSPLFSGIVSTIGMIAVILFFVTSSDSGSLVVDNLTSGGKLDSPKAQRVFWAVMEGLIAASVLLLGGAKALSTLQAAVLITGLPFAILILMMFYSLYIGLKKEMKLLDIYETKKLKNIIDKMNSKTIKNDKSKDRIS